MDLRRYLEQNGVRFQWMSHPATYTSQDLAHVEHISGRNVVKPVVVQADGRFLLCALPASHRVDLDELRRELHAENVALADEMQIRRLCPDCEVGAEPPIGALFGLPTIMDDSLFADEEVAFQAGTHQDAVRMSFSEFFRLARPTVGHFGKCA